MGIVMDGDWGYGARMAVGSFRCARSARLVLARQAELLLMMPNLAQGFGAQGSGAAIAITEWQKRWSMFSAALMEAGVMGSGF